MATRSTSLATGSTMHGNVCHFHLPAGKVLESRRSRTRSRTASLFWKRRHTNGQHYCHKNGGPATVPIGRVESFLRHFTSWIHPTSCTVKCLKDQSSSDNHSRGMVTVTVRFGVPCIEVSDCHDDGIMYCSFQCL